MMSRCPVALWEVGLLCSCLSQPNKRPCSDSSSQRPGDRRGWVKTGFWCRTRLFSGFHTSVLSVLCWDGSWFSLSWNSFFYFIFYTSVCAESSKYRIFSIPSPISGLHPNNLLILLPPKNSNNVSAVSYNHKHRGLPSVSAPSPHPPPHSPLFLFKPGGIHTCTILAESFVFSNRKELFSLESHHHRGHHVCPSPLIFHFFSPSVSYSFKAVDHASGSHFVEAKSKCCKNSHWKVPWEASWGLDVYMPSIGTPSTASFSSGIRRGHFSLAKVLIK